MILVNPVGRIGFDELANGRGILAVVVDGITPIGGVLVREVMR